MKVAIPAPAETMGVWSTGVTVTVLVDEVLLSVPSLTTKAMVRVAELGVTAELEYVIERSAACH